MTYYSFLGLRLWEFENILTKRTSRRWQKGEKYNNMKRRTCETVLPNRLDMIWADFVRNFLLKQFSRTGI